MTLDSKNRQLWHKVTLINVQIILQTITVVEQKLKPKLIVRNVNSTCEKERSIMSIKK